MYNSCMGLCQKEKIQEVTPVELQAEQVIMNAKQFVYAARKKNGEEHEPSSTAA